MKKNLPNLISGYRLVMAPVLLVFAFLGYRDLFAWGLLVSLLSDALDGFLARRFGLTSKKGSKLDSNADTLTFVAGIVGIFVFEMGFVREQLLFILLIFGLFIVELLLSYWKYGGVSSFHTYLGKSAACLLSIFVVSLFFFGFIGWFFYLATVVAVLGYLENIILVLRFPKWKSNVRGLYWVLKK